MKFKVLTIFLILVILVNIGFNIKKNNIRNKSKLRKSKLTNKIKNKQLGDDPDNNRVIDYQDAADLLKSYVRSIKVPEVHRPVYLSTDKPAKIIRWGDLQVPNQPKDMW